MGLHRHLLRATCYLLLATCDFPRATCYWLRTGCDEGARAKLVEDDRLQLGRIDGDEESCSGAEGGAHTLEAAHLVSGEKYSSRSSIGKSITAMTLALALALALD